MRCDRKYTTQLIRDFVQMESINPTLEPDARGEGPIAEQVADAMEASGMAVSKLESMPGRPTVLGKLDGRGEGPSLMLNGHLDTVGVEGMAEPFSGRIEDGRLYGRGAYDMKGAVAACLAAVKILADTGLRPPGDLWVSAVADEEAESLGTRELLEYVKPDAAIVTEPTGLAIGVAHKGFVWFDVRARGRAAHGSRPDLGADANLRMGRFLHALDDLVGALAARDAHPLLGTGSLHVGRLRGGTAPSVYAAECVATVERRTLPGESSEGCLAELRAIADRLTADDPDDRFDVQVALARPPFETTPDAPIVRCLRRALARCGVEPEFRAEAYWMDAALFADAGVDTAVIGPAGAGAHADEEWVDLESVFELAEILAATALAWGEPEEGEDDER